MAHHWVIGDTVLLETARTAKHYGYALLADDDTVFYIGKTCDPRGRLKAHVYCGSPDVRARLQRNKLNRMRILAGPMSDKEAEEWEKAKIREMLQAGIELVNQESKPIRTGQTNSRHPAMTRFARLPDESES